MPRNSGAPFSIRNWQTEIRSRASTQQTEVWIRVKGLLALSYDAESDTKDGSGADDAWREPYVVKRGAKIKLTGKPLYKPTTGETDPGQAELDHYATLVGFEGDTALKLIDPYGHAVRLDCIVAEAKTAAAADGVDREWTLELVGEPLELPYVQLQGLVVRSGAAEVTTLALALGETRALNVLLTPQSASNQKYFVLSADAQKVKPQSVDGLNFSVYAAQTTAQPVELIVRAMNGGIEKRLSVTVA